MNLADSVFMELEKQLANVDKTVRPPKGTKSILDESAAAEAYCDTMMSSSMVSPTELMRLQEPYKDTIGGGGYSSSTTQVNIRTVNDNLAFMSDSILQMSGLTYKPEYLTSTYIKEWTNIVQKALDTANNNGNKNSMFESEPMSFIKALVFQDASYGSMTIPHLAMNLEGCMSNLRLYFFERVKNYPKVKSAIAKIDSGKMEDITQEEYRAMKSTIVHQDKDCDTMYRMQATIDFARMMLNNLNDVVLKIVNKASTATTLEDAITPLMDIANISDKNAAAVEVHTLLNEIEVNTSAQRNGDITLLSQYLQSQGVPNIQAYADAKKEVEAIYNQDKERVKQQVLMKIPDIRLPLYTGFQFGYAFNHPTLAIKYPLIRNGENYLIGEKPNPAIFGPWYQSILPPVVDPNSFDGMANNPNYGIPSFTAASGAGGIPSFGGQPNIAPQYQTGDFGAASGATTTYNQPNYNTPPNNSGQFGNIPQYAPQNQTQYIPTKQPEPTYVTSFGPNVDVNKLSPFQLGKYQRELEILRSQNPPANNTVQYGYQQNYQPQYYEREVNYVVEDANSNYRPFSISGLTPQELMSLNDSCFV